MTTPRQLTIDGVHAALSILEAYHRHDFNTIKAVLEVNRDSGTALVLGLAASFDTLLRSVPGKPSEILEILRTVAYQVEAGDAQ